MKTLRSGKSFPTAQYLENEAANLETHKCPLHSPDVGLNGLIRDVPEAMIVGNDIVDCLAVCGDEEPVTGNRGFRRVRVR